uniref:DUF4939 domain-containing protein n=1 Tax=Salarias fasciatus TaxID=181472 RepID=A0A672IKY2_SALFA
CHNDGHRLFHFFLLNHKSSTVRLIISVSRLSEQVAGIAEHLAASSAVSAVAPPPAPVPAPVSLVFELQPLSYPSDRSRIAYLIGLLSGPARAWGTALWENQSPACRTYQAFTEEMKRNFDHPVKGRDAGDSGVFLRRQEGRLSETLH